MFIVGKKHIGHLVPKKREAAEIRDALNHSHGRSGIPSMCGMFIYLQAYMGVDLRFHVRVFNCQGRQGSNMRHRESFL